jgi:tartrate dehydratase beta subunit/fumarate hydratase class I family protein
VEFCFHSHTLLGAVVRQKSYLAGNTSPTKSEKQNNMADMAVDEYAIRIQTGKGNPGWAFSHSVIWGKYHDSVSLSMKIFTLFNFTIHCNTN